MLAMPSHAYSYVIAKLISKSLSTHNIANIIITLSHSYSHVNPRIYQLLQERVSQNQMLLN